MVIGAWSDADVNDEGNDDLGARVREPKFVLAPSISQNWLRIWLTAEHRAAQVS